MVPFIIEIEKKSVTIIIKKFKLLISIILIIYRDPRIRPNPKNPNFIVYIDLHQNLSIPVVLEKFYPGIPNYIL